MFTLKSLTWGAVFAVAFFAVPLFLLALVITLFAVVTPVHAMPSNTAAYLVNDVPYYGIVVSSEGINEIQTDTVAPLPYTPQIVSLVSDVQKVKRHSKGNDTVNVPAVSNDTTAVQSDDKPAKNDKPADSSGLTNSDKPIKVHSNNGGGNGQELDSNGNDMDPNVNPHANDND